MNYLLIFIAAVPIVVMFAWAVLILRWMRMIADELDKPQNKEQIEV